MKFNQEIGKILKSQLEIDLQETGFEYVFTDKLLFGRPRVEKVFISYGNITNQKTYSRRNHPDSKKIIFTLVGIFIACFIAVVVSSTAIVTGSPYEGYFTAGFYVALIAVFLFYKFIAVQKVVTMSELQGLTFLILDNNQADVIVQKIWEMRNKYMREKFIEKDNYKTLSIEGLEYLASIGVVDRQEAIQLKEKIRPNTAGPLGFDKEVNPVS